MDTHDNSSTEVKRSETKLYIQARLPVIEPDITSSIKSLPDPEVTSSFIPTRGSEINKFGWNGPHPQKRGNGKWGTVPSDIRCAVVHPGLNGDVEKDVTLLPNIVSDIPVVDTRRSRELTITKPLVISCRGSSRRTLSVDRASLLKPETKKPLYMPKPPMYRLTTDNYGSRAVTSHEHISPRAPRKIMRKSASFRGVPIKQSYFILQKPGVITKSSRSHSGPMLANHSLGQEKTTTQNPDKSLSEKNQMEESNPDKNEIDKQNPELELYSISFRESDSPIFDSVSEPIHSELSYKDMVIGLNMAQRMRSAKFPNDTDIPGCLTGTSKILHSRSDFRFT